MSNLDFGDFDFNNIKKSQTENLLKTYGLNIEKSQKEDKVRKVMKEFKEGTLTSHGKIVTDRDQAIAIALSEAKINKADYTPEQLKELIKEHERLIDTMQSPSKEDDKKEVKDQKEELEGYKKDLKKSFDILYGENDIEKGGEGSRGGKIIGHTKSGKAIYANFSRTEKNTKQTDTSNFTEEDLKEALKEHVDRSHREKYSDLSDEEISGHMNEASKIRKKIKDLKEKEVKKSEESVDVVSKAFEILEKGMNHKYFKREGTPGNYKYYYTEADYKAGKSSSEEKVSASNESKEMTKEDAKKLLGIAGKIEYANTEHNKKMMATAVDDFLKELRAKHATESDKEKDLSDLYKENKERKEKIDPKQHTENFEKFKKELKESKDLDATYKKIANDKDHIDMPVSMQNELGEYVEKLEQDNKKGKKDKVIKEGDVKTDNKIDWNKVNKEDKEALDEELSVVQGDIDSYLRWKKEASINPRSRYFDWYQKDKELIDKLDAIEDKNLPIEEKLKELSKLKDINEYYLANYLKSAMDKFKEIKNNNPDAFTTTDKNQTRLFK